MQSNPVDYNAYYGTVQDRNERQTIFSTSYIQENVLRFKQRGTSITQVFVVPQDRTGRPPWYFVVDSSCAHLFVEPSCAHLHTGKLTRLRPAEQDFGRRHRAEDGRHGQRAERHDLHRVRAVGC